MFSPLQLEELEAISALRQSGEVHDPDLNCFFNYLAVSRKRESVTVIDVGANRGQSIVSFKTVFPNARIISFEANSFFDPVLQKVASWYEDVRVNSVGLGRTNQDSTLMVPVVDGKHYWEEASIREDNFHKPWVQQRLASYGDLLAFQEYPVRIRRADELLEDIHADIVKIDVEGAELDVLQAMEKLVTRSRPIFMIENSDWHNVTAWLEERGYACYQYLLGENALVPLRVECTNSFYIPKEYQGPLTDVIRAL